MICRQWQTSGTRAVATLHTQGDGYWWAYVEALRHSGRHLRRRLGGHTFVVTMIVAESSTLLEKMRRDSAFLLAEVEGFIMGVFFSFRKTAIVTF